MMHLRAYIQERSIPVPEAGCWLWTASAHSDKGYGASRMGTASRLAHRASYEAFIGPIPKGMQVLHKCDTPSCVNPDHLFIGTNIDNAKDRRDKGRYMGEWNGRAVLTESQAIEILKLSATSRVPELDGLFPVSIASIYDLVAGRTWKHLPRKNP